MTLLSRIIALIAGLAFAPMALALDLPDAPCSPEQFGCGAGPDNILMNALTGAGGVGAFSIASQMLYLATGLSVLFIIWAGVQMIISMGDEGKVSQHKWAIAYALIGLGVTILSQFIISVVGTENYGQVGDFRQLPLNLVTSAANILRNVLNAVFVIITVIAGMRMVYAQGKEDDYNAGKKMMFWAIVGAVIVNLSAGLVYAVVSFFGLQ